MLSPILDLSIFFFFFSQFVYTRMTRMISTHISNLALEHPISPAKKGVVLSDVYHVVLAIVLLLK